MKKKYLAVMALALIIGFVSTSEAELGVFRQLVLALGPLFVVGLLVALHYEKKSKA